MKNLLLIFAFLFSVAAEAATVILKIRPAGTNQMKGAEQSIPLKVGKQELPSMGDWVCSAQVDRIEETVEGVVAEGLQTTLTCLQSKTVKKPAFIAGGMCYGLKNSKKLLKSQAIQINLISVTDNPSSTGLNIDCKE